jgi:CheY-like chemotaxis protein
MSTSILVVDDIAANRNLLSATLEPKGYEVLLASNGTSALKVASRAQPNLILMDVNMPEMDGYEACRQLKTMPGLAEIPVIFITANDDPDSLVKGFQAGGVDYITKPFKEQEVLMRVETHVKIHTLTRRWKTATGELAVRNSELKRRCEEGTEEKPKPTGRASFRSSVTRCARRSSPSSVRGLTNTLSDEALAKYEDAARIPAGGQLLDLINNLLDLSPDRSGQDAAEPRGVRACPLVELGKDAEPLVRRNGNKCGAVRRWGSSRRRHETQAGPHERQQRRKIQPEC